jgi:hypothetical protein
MPDPIDIEITESRPGLRLDRYLADAFRHLTGSVPAN